MVICECGREMRFNNTEDICSGCGVYVYYGVKCRTCDILICADCVWKDKSAFF
jgi:hypothetical protein